MGKIDIYLKSNIMPSKRRNNGRSKSGRGHAGNVRCANCSRIVPKDKAIKKFQVRDLIDAASKEDIAKASAYKTPTAVPKLMIKMYYCVSCAIVARRKRDTGKKKFMNKRENKPKTDENKEEAKA